MTTYYLSFIQLLSKFFNLSFIAQFK